MPNLFKVGFAEYYWGTVWLPPSNGDSENTVRFKFSLVEDNSRILSTPIKNLFASDETVTIQTSYSNIPFEVGQQINVFGEKYHITRCKQRRVLNAQRARMWNDSYDVYWVIEAVR